MHGTCLGSLLCILLLGGTTYRPVVRRLLEAGADPNARVHFFLLIFYSVTYDIKFDAYLSCYMMTDLGLFLDLGHRMRASCFSALGDGESGWSSLHRALHFGHLAVACVLLQFGALLILGDSKSRTPVDLISGPVLQAIGKENSSVNTEVFSWGCGVNYQLGTGNAHIQKLPCKVESLHGSFIKSISAAKFQCGSSCIGQAAVITPRQVTMGLGARRVKAVAAAKHHTVVATEGGEVFTWGSNREGQLGYTSVDTQPTPRRVSSLKARIMAVSAANKHTAVVSEAGEIYTWGCNKDGQLGYGISNSASNYSPRVVAYLKGKHLVGVSAAKYHTIMLENSAWLTELMFLLLIPPYFSFIVFISFFFPKRCQNLLQEIVIRNLDYILAVAVQTFIGASFDILIDLEKLLDLKSSEPWSCRQLPTPTAKFPAILNSEDEKVEDDTLRTHNDGTEGLNFCNEGSRRLDGFLQSDDAAVEGVHKRIRALRKELQQIELLEEKQSRGHLLDGQQISKLVMRSAVEIHLLSLVHQMKLFIQKHLLKLAINSEPGIGKGFLDAEVRDETNKVKEKAANFWETRVPESHSKKAVNIPLDATAAPTASKKKKRKGGLSMFLSGALDDVPKSVAPPPPVVMPKDEQSKTETKPTKKIESEDHAEGNNGKLPLRSIICSSPIAMAPARKASLPDEDGNTPPWAASGTPPSLSRPSLRDIQFQQACLYMHGKKQQLGVSHSPQNSTTGFSVMNGLGSPSESVCCFEPLVQTGGRCSRSIRMEERAIKDLKRFYSNVRIVKNQL
ncbi:hypothetical protein SASPL_108488 [Salvia splendens]|uniref:E3 ubiquitin-protein ligase HERC2 n=1 Tax=Salvia splendens TaxID=180675 RepID=A0A8X9A692_SALSN|nr:hypothetical protein SASPL_108488 [Salvia splendens]